MAVYLVTLGYDYGDAEYGPKYSKAEVLIDANSAEEAEAIADQEYGYPATGEPYEGCWATEATQSDIDRLSRSTDWDDVEFPFSASTSIKASYWDDEGDLDYSERKELAEKLYQVVKKYFSEDIKGWPSPRIDYHSYDILKYTFTIGSGTRSVSSIGYQFDDQKYDLNEFKNEFRAVLKPYGFNKFKFNLPTRKRKYDWWGETKTETYKDFYAVYFDKK